MSLADARLHPWLAAQHAAAAPAPAPAALPAPAAPAALPAPRRTASPEPDHPVDESMRSIALDGMALEDHGEPMDAEPSQSDDGRRTPEWVPEDEGSQSQLQANGAAVSAISRQPSRLRRRVDIIRSAENRGEELPGPSQEMQERAAAEDAEENGAGPSRKRKAAAALDFDASLTPMEEEEEEDEPQPAAAPAARGRGAPANKRGRGGKKASAPPPTAARRGRGRAAASALAIAAPPANGDDDDAGGLRRSTRIHQSSPVKRRG